MTTQVFSEYLLTLQLNSTQLNSLSSLSTTKNFCQIYKYYDIIASSRTLFIITYFVFYSLTTHPLAQSSLFFVLFCILIYLLTYVTH